MESSQPESALSTDFRHFCYLLQQYSLQLIGFRGNFSDTIMRLFQPPQHCHLLHNLSNCEYNKAPMLVRVNPEECLINEKRIIIK